MTTSSLYSALSAALPAGTPLYLGKKRLTDNASPPRLVLIPSTDSYGPPDRAALAPGRVLWTRQAGYELILWGRDINETELILGETLSALHYLAGISVQIIGGEWADDSWLTLGYAYILRIAVAAPVIKAEQFAALEAIAQECGGLIE